MSLAISSTFCDRETGSFFNVLELADLRLLAYDSAPKREEETMRKLGDVSVGKVRWFAGVSFAAMALWTWYNFVRA